MRSVSMRLIQAAALALLAVIPLAPGPAKAQAGRGSPISLEVDEGTTLRLASAASNVFVANPEVADIQVPTDNTVLVVGRKPGATSVIALGEGGREIGRWLVRVVHPLTQLRGEVRARFPTVDVQFVSTPRGIIVGGRVDTPEEASSIMAIAGGFVENANQLINQLTVGGSVQVQLRVYIAEISRNVDERYGVNWQGFFRPGIFRFGLLTGREALNEVGAPIAAGADILLGGVTSANGRVNVDAVLDLLAEEGLATVLAEPTLTAISGQSASFISGGETPVPLRSDDGITVEYKQYGIRLDFTPTVLSADRISIAVRPEVSDLSERGAITLDGFRIQGVQVRRVETTIELASGESFAIGGLLQSSGTDTNRRLPGVGDIPLLGRLFQTRTFRSNESELVVIVTPFIVRPNAPNAVQLPVPPQAAGPVQRMLVRTLPGGGGDPTNAPPLLGAAGFMFR